MKEIFLHAAGATALTFGVAVFMTSAQQPAPPAITVAEDPEYANYLDAPQSAGTWVYVEEPGETLAVYGTGPGASTFLMRCAEGSVALARVADTPAEQSRAMSVVTETVTRQLEVNPLGMNNVLFVNLAPTDPLLDAMAITKGRFAVEVEGEQTLYLPAWAEVTRVIEDCR